MLKFVVLVFSFLGALKSIHGAPAAKSLAISSIPLYVALQSQGILTISFDPSKDPSSSLEILSVNTNTGFMPGWLTAHDDKVYSVSRTYFPNNNSIDGGVFSFQELQKPTSSGILDTLAPINSVSSGGLGGVACDVSRDGKTIGVANM